MRTKYKFLLIFLSFILVHYACEPAFEESADFAAPSPSTLSFTGILIKYNKDLISFIYL